tara:strand:+ start:315 stop:479 length:165 start_codon:yes stop_codon:yes gene_type:complete
MKKNIPVGNPADLSKIFGSLKGKRKLSGQEMKDLVREGWKNRRLDDLIKERRKK